MNKYRITFEYIGEDELVKQIEKDIQKVGCLQLYKGFSLSTGTRGYIGTLKVSDGKQELIIEK